jgi:hypothetical protein
MSGKGWIKVWRKIADNPMWTAEPFTRGQAFIDLLLLAQGTDNEVEIDGKVVKFEAGTVYVSVLELSNRWKWSRGKVNRFLDGLQNDTTIRTIKRTPNGTAVTIENWGFYQHGGGASGQRNGQRNGHKNGQRGGHNKEEYSKEVLKKNKEGNAPTPLGGVALPEFGQGDCCVVYDCERHYYPKEWEDEANERGWEIEQFVRWNHHNGVYV